ncbi:16S rRNA (cytidine(1402)-2'-O)-methyltransferase [Porticoccus sp. GXU_MW_L64]
MAGELYVVATPIGNLGDMVPRGVEALQSAHIVAAEDTRHSRRLLDHLGIDKPLVAYHDHSGNARSDSLLQALRDGKNVALVSDAGTPLISDPGYRIVRQARQEGIAVSPIPGPCAAVAALSAAGLPTDRFTFEGFLPAKSAGRCKALQQLASETRTMVFYEAPHRVLDCLRDMAALFGGDRDAVLAREVTKAFETFHGKPLAELVGIVAADSNQQRGEIVLVVAGAEPKEQIADNLEQQRVLGLLLEELSVKQASTLAAKITGGNKKELYKLAVEMKDAG